MAFLDGRPGRRPGLCDGAANQHAAVRWESGLVLSDVGSACGSRRYIEIRSLSRSVLGWEEPKSGGLCVFTSQPLPPVGSWQGPTPNLHLSSGEDAGLQFFSAALGARSIWEMSSFYILECQSVYIMSSHS